MSDINIEYFKVSNPALYTTILMMYESVHNLFIKLYYTPIPFVNTGSPFRHWRDIDDELYRFYDKVVEARTALLNDYWIKIKLEKPQEEKEKDLGFYYDYYTC